jgi:hypothetical protein|tara:strand:+ start:1453 stop:1617 length:165 start_codon:yes stop_codon:yes gene_type:complete
MSIEVKAGDVLVIKDKTYHAIYHRDNGYCIVNEAEYKVWKQWNDYYDACDSGKI